MSDDEAAFLRVLNTDPHARAVFDSARYAGDHDEVAVLKRMVVALSAAREEAMGIATKLAESQVPASLFVPSVDPAP